MSYARLNEESDVYVYASERGYCINLDREKTWESAFIEDSPKSCADRLEELRMNGLRVPQGAIDRLRREEKSGKFDW